jgi:hypothetical protein
VPRCECSHAGRGCAQGAELFSAPEESQPCCLEHSEISSGASPLEDRRPQGPAPVTLPPYGVGRGKNQREKKKQCHGYLRVGVGCQKSWRDGSVYAGGLLPYQNNTQISADTQIDTGHKQKPPRGEVGRIWVSRRAVPARLLNWSDIRDKPGLNQESLQVA